MRISGISTITLVFTALTLAACTDDGGGEDEAGPTTTDTTTGDTTTGDETTTADGTTTAGDTTAGDTTGDTTGGDTTGGVANEACMGAVAPAGSLAVGQPVSHWAGGFTVEGDEWDYCEMGGTPFLFIMSAGWCGPCHDLAGGLAGDPSQWDPQLEPIRAGLEAGTLGVVEFLVDNFADFDAVALSDLQNWESMHPNEFVHLIGDPTVGVNGEEPLWGYFGPSHGGALPGGVLIDADFNLEVMTLPEAIATAGSKYGG